MGALYPDTDDCKTFMGIAGSGEDAVIDWLVAGAVAFVERYCDRSFLDAESQTVYVMPEYPNLLGRGRRMLYVPDVELVGVDTVTNGDGEEVADYRLLPVNGPPYFMVEIDRDAGQCWNRGSDGEGVVTIEGTTGYGTSVPDDVFMAILGLVAWLYRSRSSGGGGPVTTATRAGLVIAPSEVPGHLRELLDLYRR